jgi:DNA-binding MarR family transcriptional regulator
MKSLSDSSKGEQSSEDKILRALERLSRVFRLLLWDIAKEEKISPIQIQFLLYLLDRRREQCRISSLAKEFGLSLATVSDSIKTLVKKGLVSRKLYEGDKRVVILELTPSGRRLAERVTGWQEVMRAHIKRFPPDIKETVMIFLMELINSLRNEGIISVARICISCNHFQRNVHPNSEKPHHCSLTDRPLAPADFRIDCPEHTPVILN